MLSAEATKYTAQAIIQLLNGDKQKFNEYVDKAMKFHHVEPKEVKCRYKINGQWIPARINWTTGVVRSLDGQILWEGKKLCG